jgi:hypothetical protein
MNEKRIEKKSQENQTHCGASVLQSGDLSFAFLFFFLLIQKPST